MAVPAGSGGRLEKQQARQRAIAADVMAEGTIKIETLAERHQISLMTIHRDLDELAVRGLLRKSRGSVTALSTSLVEASDMFRRGRQESEKKAVARRALDYIEPGQSIIIDDSTTTAELAPLLPERAPLTVITNYLPLINELNGIRDLTVVGLGGELHSWSNSFMGYTTNVAIRALSVDLALISTSAITNDVCYHQAQVTVETKKAMLEVAARRILMVDHTKFERRALHALAGLDEFDHVVVDARTSEAELDRLRRGGVDVQVAEERE